MRDQRGQGERRLLAVVRQAECCGGIEEAAGGLSPIETTFNDGKGKKSSHISQNGNTLQFQEKPKNGPKCTDVSIK